MKKNLKNEVHTEGYLFEHDLTERPYAPKDGGKPTTFITGSISIATDEDCLNVVKITHNFCTPLRKNGSANPNYRILKKILEGELKTVIEEGKENAAKLSCNNSIGFANEYYANLGSDQETLVTVQAPVNGFINEVTNLSKDEKKRNTFECDVILHNVRRIEATNEDEKDRMVISGYVFDYRKQILPVEFEVVNLEEAMDYFEDLNISKKNLVFTRVWGRNVSQTITKTYSEESAFGESHVKEVTKNKKAMVVTGAKGETYEWDSEGTITTEEFKKLLSDREMHLASVRQRQEENKNKKKNVISSPKQEFKTKTENEISDERFNF